MGFYDKGNGASWHAMLNLKSPESTATASCDAPVEREKRPRDYSDSWTMSWSLDKCRRLEILGDSKLVISWINGTWEVRSKEDVEIERDIVLVFERYLSAENRCS